MIRFILNEKEVETGLPAGMVLLDFIRYHQHLAGTKIGCREGDCGACTILVGELVNDRLQYRSVTSCLMPLGNAQGKHIVTVEGVNFSATLNPIQQAMAEAGATQCGFCTPGFVMSLAGFCLAGKTPTLENAIASVDGNICRCTGYKSIENAAARIASLLEGNAGSVEYACEKEILPRYFTGIKSRLQRLAGEIISEGLKEPAGSGDRPRFVGGGTDLYVQKHEEMKGAAIRFLLDQPQFNCIVKEGDRCLVGPSATVADMQCSPVINEIFPDFPRYAKLVSSTPIRNMATIAGNFINASPIGDFTIFFMALDAQLILSGGKEIRTLPLKKLYKSYKQLNITPGEQIEKIWFELPSKDSFFNFEKVSKRTHLDIASVNTAIHVKMSGDKITHASLAAGGVAPVPLFLEKTSSFLEGKKLTTELVDQAVALAQSEISPISDARGSKEYKTMLLGQLLRAHFAAFDGSRSRSLPGKDMGAGPAKAGGRAGLNIDSFTHLRGESVYLDDIPVVNGTLYAAVLDSPVAHGKIEKLDTSAAAQLNGVVRIFTAKDIPGQNQIGGIVPDEELLASADVHFCGMPVALVVAETSEIAYAAIKKINLEITPLPVITDPRTARVKNELIVPPRVFRIGDIESAWAACDHIVEGRADSNGQEHMYIETQGAYAVPQENDVIRIYSSTQGPTAVQRTTARVLGLGMNKIEVDTTRIGGGFGGKEDQATTWAVMVALACYHLRKPVKYSLHRMEDMRMTGKRHPYSSDFRIGLNKDLKIVAYEATFYQNAGAAADLSPAVLERTLFHCTNSYFIPNVKATAYSCRTNLPPNTAFRGFGGPQGMFVIEAAIAKAAEQLGIAANQIQQRNLLKTGDEFPYGQKAESEANECWNKAVELYDLETLRREIGEFNRNNSHFKKGFALMPVCFGISFTKTMMNQGRALVHVYTDGTVNVSTGAVEMGQGVNTKILQVAANTLSVDRSRVKVSTTNTYRIANTSPSAASATADLNGRATELACLAILNRMKTVAVEAFNTDPGLVELRDEWVYAEGKKTEWNWQRLAFETYLRRISLSEHAHYTPPGIHYNLEKEKGHPFSYHVYGTAIICVTIDCLRGTYEFDSVKAVHDAGQSMNPMIDLGQCEGGIVQGIGWMTMEEVVYDTKGRLRSNALSTYKVPDIYSAPKEISVHFLDTKNKNLAVLQSKAVGEPPLMYGIGAFFALRNAIKAFNPLADVPFDAPMTPEKVLLNLYQRPAAPSATKEPVVEK